MDLRQIRWTVALVVAIVLCGVLWFGGNAIRTLTVTLPLQNAMASADSVEHVEMINGTDGLTVVLTVKPGADLQTAYEAAMAQAGLKAQHAVAHVVVKDSDDPVLTKLYRERIAFILHEAIATGRYADLPDRVRAAAGNLQATVTIDETHLYLTLQDGDKTLYQVVNRQVATPKTGGESW
jgi:predicted RND superfamily exporter protein